MMKIFKSVYIAGFAACMMLFSVSLASAGETANSPAKNGKVVSDSAAVQNKPNKQAGDTGSSQRRTRSSAWVLHAEQWELARSGESVLSLSVINQVMDAWLKDKAKSIEIQYPGGEEGELWVQQLSDWLVALGVPSASMVTVPGSGADDVIRFNLIK